MIDYDLSPEEKRQIQNEAEVDRVPICCGEPMSAFKYVSEYWGFKKTITEYTCDVCGKFFEV